MSVNTCVCKCNNVLLDYKRLSREPEEEGSQEQAARREAVQGAQFPLEVCCSLPSPFVVPVFCLFFSKPALL